MANIGTISLNAGKMTPLIDTRSDTEKYSSGCRIIDNMIPRIYGPAERRPGTKRFANTADDSKKSKLLPFIFSSTVAYKLEFGDQIINVYFEQTLVDTVVSPYLEADLFQLQTKQSADVMWIVHPSYAPRKFSRVSVTEFTLTSITFDNGPFIERNDIVVKDGRAITVTGFTIATASTGGGIGTDNFTIEGTDGADATVIKDLFTTNQRFYVTDSTGNDAAYTVNATTPTTKVGTTVTVFANEAIEDGTDDGEIMVDGGTVTLSSSASTFESGHIAALFKLTHKRLKTVTKGTIEATGVIGEAIDVKENWTFTTTGNWDATVEIQRLEDGTNWETFRTFVSTISNGVGSFNAQKSDVEEADGVQFRINVTSYTKGKVEVTFIVDKSTQDSIFRISAVEESSSATAIAVVAAPDNVAATRWAEGSWSSKRGYPSAITFFQERAVYAFTNSDAQTVWPSGSGRFEDFEAGLKAADSFGLRLETAERGRWLGALEVLAAGTAGGEWVLKTPVDEPLTPINFKMEQQTRRGSADIQALEVNEAILFINSVARKVREFTFSDAKQKHVSPDLTALAEDITSGGITSVAVQTRPDSIIWFTIANSPYLISMTYEREQNVVAWANHPFGGGGIVESVIVTPGATEDVITLSVKRTINESTVRFIEEMQPRDFGSTTDATDAFFVDAGIIDLSGSTTIANLGHLEGETVSVLVDGAVQAEQIVSGGQITVTAGTKAIVGLPCPYQVSPMRLDFTTGAGTSLGSITNISEIVLSLFASGNVRYGDGEGDFPIPFRTDEDYDSPPDLFTGDTGNLAFEGGFTTERNIVISGSDPLPCTVRAIVARVKQTGR